MEHNAERARTEVASQEYLENLRAHNAHMKHSLGLNKMQVEEKVPLAEQKWDLKVWEAMLVLAQEHVLNPCDGQDLLAELVELREHLAGVKEEHVAETKELAALVVKTSKALADLVLPPYPGVPSGLEESSRGPRGDGHHAGMLAGGSHLRSWSLGLSIAGPAATRLLNMAPNHLVFSFNIRNPRGPNIYMCSWDHSLGP
jgi:hypothetical protein